MLIVRENVSLKGYNTFGIEAVAEGFYELVSLEAFNRHWPELKSRFPNILILGGGSNLLFGLDYFSGLVIHNKLMGKEVLYQDGNEIVVRIASGENWHDFVSFCVQQNYGGLENLSLIPGTVGAAPIQNIGAYGVELKDSLLHVEAFNLETGKIEYFNNEDCNFGYRTSIFKTKLKGKVLITAVIFRLTINEHTLHTHYGAIEEELIKLQLPKSIEGISKAVISIRQSKLPDPKQIGNAGSFFKNPEISIAEFSRLKSAFPLVPSYPVSEELVKVPAGWLIENAGWKGRVIGNVGVHDNQALVLVNKGNARGGEVIRLANNIIAEIEQKFGVVLEPEVNLIG